MAIRRATAALWSHRGVLQHMTRMALAVTINPLTEADHMVAASSANATPLWSARSTTRSCARACTNLQQGVSHAPNTFVLRNCEIRDHVGVAEVRRRAVSVMVRHPLAAATRVSRSHAWVPHDRHVLLRHVRVACADILVLKMLPVLGEGDVHIEAIALSLTWRQHVCKHTGEPSSTYPSYHHSHSR